MHASSTSSHQTKSATRRRSTARGVRRLTGPVHAYILNHGEPERYEGFTTFNAGDPNTEEAVREVHQTAERLHAGTITMAQTPVVVEDASGGFIGYCSIHRRPPFGYPDGNPRPWIAERYIVAVGRDLEYRKCPLRDNTTYVGEIVVRAGLDMIAIEAVGKPMPSVSALVRPENGSSHRVLETYGFVCTPTTTTGSQDVLWREAGESLPPAPGLDVYVPPFSPAGGVGRNDPCPCGSGKKFKKCCER